MAYLDDNNENLTSQGDPLEKLDRELAELRATLEQMDVDGKLPEEEIPADILRQDKPEPESAEEAVEVTKPASDQASPIKPEPPKKSRAPLIAVIIVLCVALVGGIGFGIYRAVSSQKESQETDAAQGELVTINDSEMGTVTLRPVDGAEISTYSAENLKKDANGYYEYYENGKKISHLGVDLSEYQGEVDFEKVKASGVEFVMLRIGGRFYGTEGKLYEDGAFDTYYEQAKAAGLKVGAYYFSQAASVADAQEEAAQTIKKLNGRTLDYPVAFDWENIGDDEARTDGVTGAELTSIAEAFCDAINEAGYKSIVYANAGQMFVMYDFETMKNYDFWLADYREFPTMYYNYDMWQYATDGTVDGIEGEVDLNISFTDFTETA
ncbi:MAG: Lyzozyme M1 (1,4-beta-N-acetylmuramidase) [Ruminococcus sp.]|nr:Lyzozyme M1 (1,4-beta-N-acetylmuramidase) [Ruminococcus sp.]